MRIYLVAGELSGDAHGAALMRALRTQHGEVRFSGAGGPEMQSLADDHFAEWTSHAVVGLFEVMKKYPYFWGQLGRMEAEVGEVQADAVVLIDYPGFNLRLAARLRRRYPKLKIIYYISPQVWAWNQGRIPKMARWLDLMICLFPFEKDLYEKSGLRTEFAGHPMLDELEEKRLPEVRRDNQLLGIFPGSREREVRKILPIMLETAAILRKTHPALRIAIPAASEKLLALITEMTTRSPGCEISLRNAYTLMQTCGSGMIASGTATLEAAFFGLPYVLLYKVTPLTYAIGRRVIRVPFLGMVNILAGREVIPEFVQDGAIPEKIAETLEAYLVDPARRGQVKADMRSVIAQLGDRGAAQKAADAVWKLLKAG